MLRYAYLATVTGKQLQITPGDNGPACLNQLNGSSDSGDSFCTLSRQGFE
tara:strand:- start:128096 stop:128245 length:150 start_codon:yes stop_codon:yes gene_type:complete